MPTTLPGVQSILPAFLQKLLSSSRFSIFPDAGHRVEFGDLVGHGVLFPLLCILQILSQPDGRHHAVSEGPEDVFDLDSQLIDNYTTCLFSIPDVDPVSSQSPSAMP